MIFKTDRALAVNRQMQNDPNHEKHGTAGGYAYYGCRCDKCRAWANKKHKKYRDHWREHPELIRPEEHGKWYTYTTKSCRCELCTAAASAYSREHPKEDRANRPSTIDNFLAFRNNLDDPRHGTMNGYGNYQCRCDKCRAANAAMNKAARERRSKNIPDNIHGKASTYYNYKCRCEACTNAKSNVELRRKQS